MGGGGTRGRPEVNTRLSLDSYPDMTLLHALTIQYLQLSLKEYYKWAPLEYLARFILY